MVILRFVILNFKFKTSGGFLLCILSEKYLKCLVCSVSTLRYYDKEGPFPDMMRVSGVRKFSDRELETLRVIECLKKSGMEIKDIRQFIEWCAMGKETYPQRRAMFQRQRREHRG
ncbi:MAG: MerR family transcriptional regulator [Blautia sp.]